MGSKDGANWYDGVAIENHRGFKQDESEDA